jgi:catechol 2,3-dioxygenase-like lactoylglutathione lyase family enzyme
MEGKAMSLHLDHIVIAVDDLMAAIQDYRDLGFSVVPGGVHANRATYNALITFADATYLELLAATHDPPVPNLIDFGVLLHVGEGLAGFALRSDDLEVDAARLRADGFSVGDVIPGERRRADGTVLQWKLALVDGGFAPFLIQDVTPRIWRVPNDPAVTAHFNHVTGIRYIEIAVQNETAARNRYTRLLGVTPTDLALDNAIGCIKLHEDTNAARSEILFAVQLVPEQSEDVRFPPEQTHNVRFR